MKNPADYSSLGPDQILEAVESQSFPVDGRLLEMNSFENRVYEVGLVEGSPIIVKFYRPNRWSEAAIREEHAFSLSLDEREIPLVPPLKGPTGDTLFESCGYRYALFQRRGGRPPDFESQDQLRQLGRFVGRLHAVGRERPYQHRPALNDQTFGSDCSAFLLENDFIPSELRQVYESLSTDLMQRVHWCYERCPNLTLIRTHGDCHRGNILWTDQGVHIVDMDDSRMAPAVQDLWMFLAGSRDEQETSLRWLLEGYVEFSDFNPAELHLIEALRTLRLIHYFAWIARRWTDPAFPRAFPWFNTTRAWEQHILDLREQAALMDEPALVWHG